MFSTWFSIDLRSMQSVEKMCVFLFQVHQLITKPWATIYRKTSKEVFQNHVTKLTMISSKYLSISIQDLTQSFYIF